MGNTSSRVKKRVSRSGKRIKQHDEEIKKCGLTDEEVKEACDKHYISEAYAPSTGKAENDIDYDSDAKTLDINKFLAFDISKAQENTKQHVTKEHRKPESTSICRNGSSTLIDYHLRPESDKTPQEVIETPQCERNGPKQPLLAPRSPNLGPTRLPSLSASANSPRWRLSYDEASTPQKQLSPLVHMANRPKHRNSTSAVMSPYAGQKVFNGSLLAPKTVKAVENIHPLLQSSACMVSSARNSHETNAKCSSSSLHLQSMRISQHLRSFSNISVNTTTDDVSTSRYAAQTRNDNFAFPNESLAMRCHQHTSSTGFESIRVPTTWCKVLNDDASSIYSNRTSSVCHGRPSLNPEQGKRASAETIRIASHSEQSSPAKLTVSREDGDIDCDKYNVDLGQSCDSSSGLHISAVDGGRSTPCLVIDEAGNAVRFSPKLDTKGKNNESFKENRNQSHTKPDSPSKSFVADRVVSLKNIIPRARTRVSLVPLDSASPFDGVEERRSKRSKSMYSLKPDFGSAKFTLKTKKRGLEVENATGYPNAEKRKIKGSAFSRENILFKTGSADVSETPKGKRRLFYERKSMYQLKNSSKTILEPNRRAKGSWAKFPSHTREARNGSAGADDYVSTRDFADELKAEVPCLFGEDALRNADGFKKNKKTGGSKVAKSKSMYFGKSLLKGYARLFKTGESQEFAKGHRSSISVSGTMEHPDLEMISPVFPTSHVEDCLQSTPPNNLKTPVSELANNDHSTKGAIQWSQMYQNCLTIPRISEDDHKAIARGEGSSETSNRRSSSASSLRAPHECRSLYDPSHQSLRGSTKDFTELLQETEKQERAKVMQIAVGEEDVFV